MAITKKSLIGKTSTNNSTKHKTAPPAATGPVTPGKTVPAMRLEKQNLQTSKLSGLQLGRTYF
jgi:hypothetical protein